MPHTVVEVNFVEAWHQTGLETYSVTIVNIFTDNSLFPFIAESFRNLETNVPRCNASVRCNNDQEGVTTKPKIQKLKTP